MEQDLNEYDPLEPLYVWNSGDDVELFDEPMTDDDWEEWLNND